MGALTRRVKRIERSRQQAQAKSKDHHYGLMRLVNGSLVREVPGIDTVRPEHTDPETYRDRGP